MQYLFKTIAFFADEPIYYTVYQVAIDSFFAEVMNKEAENVDFLFSRRNDEWYAEDIIHQNQAQQIGENIDDWFRHKAQRRFLS